MEIMVCVQIHASFVMKLGKRNEHLLLMNW
uniref:Uncharacterized protein n=1 Tax=Arundo donax TaxID=35708 RepID=A0A0A8YEX6_ARUDO